MGAASLPVQLPLAYLAGVLLLVGVFVSPKGRECINLEDVV